MNANACSILACFVALRIAVCMATSQQPHAYNFLEFQNTNLCPFGGSALLLARPYAVGGTLSAVCKSCEWL